MPIERPKLQKKSRKKLKEYREGLREHRGTKIGGTGKRNKRNKKKRSRMPTMKIKRKTREILPTTRRSVRRSKTHRKVSKNPTIPNSTIPS